MQKKLQLDIDKDTDEPGVCLPFISATVVVSKPINVSGSMVWSLFCITVEELSVCEPLRKKPRLDIDSDSAIGVSLFTDGKSTTMSISEVSRSQSCLQVVNFFPSCVIGPSGQRDRRPG